MGRYQDNDHLCHGAAAGLLGVSAVEFAELRRSHEAPEPDVLIAGDPPRWKRETISKYKRQRARLKTVHILGR